MATSKKRSRTNIPAARMKATTDMLRRHNDQKADELEGALKNLAEARRHLAKFILKG